jgi:hypothetical protein
MVTSKAQPLCGGTHASNIRITLLLVTLLTLFVVAQLPPAGATHGGDTKVSVSDWNSSRQGPVGKRHSGGCRPEPSRPAG